MDWLNLYIVIKIKYLFEIILTAQAFNIKL